MNINRYVAPVRCNQMCVGLAAGWCSLAGARWMLWCWRDEMSANSGTTDQWGPSVAPCPHPSSDHHDTRHCHLLHPRFTLLSTCLAFSCLAVDRTIQLSKYVSHLLHSPGYRRYKPQLKPSPRRCGSRWVKCEGEDIKSCPRTSKIHLSIYRVFPSNLQIYIYPW